MAQGIEKSNQPGDLGSALETSESPARKWQSFLLSTTIHTGLLVALALLWTSRVIGGGDEGPRSVQIVLASAADDNEYFEEADLEEIIYARALRSIHVVPLPGTSRGAAGTRAQPLFKGGGC